MHLAPLIQDLAIILGVAALMSFLFRWAKQPVVLAYVVAGIIVGPYTPPVFSILDQESVKVWAELGVIFLMFALGLEFSFRRLAKVGVSAFATATLQIVSMLFAGYWLGRLLGWNSMNALFLGSMISISSTTIIIKALEEMGLKTRRFAELVFGILIVEDLAAILLLVGLTNIATQSSLSGLMLAGAAFKLALVVGAWLLIGMFVVPRIIQMVSKRGNDEMMLVFALGLCLALVALSAYFHYSVALGAFIMGSILAETQESHRIERLINPLKDIFGAIFFVSVGMLLDPSVIVDNGPAVAAICLVIILGKMLTVALGALITGQSLSNSIHTGMSMAQIGEFSFIIATLGLTLGAIDDKVYPIIVAASLITTFTTPYFIRAAPGLTHMLQRRLPTSWLDNFDSYGLWLQRRAVNRSWVAEMGPSLLRWGANAIILITIFVVSAAWLLPWCEERLENNNLAHVVAWSISFLAASPFIWAMLTTKLVGSKLALERGAGARGGDLTFRLLTFMAVAVLSTQFFAFWFTLATTIVAAGVVFYLFRKQLEAYYQWFESQFVSGIAPSTVGDTGRHAHLVPWDAHLSEVEVSSRSPLAGKSLLELQLREKFGTSVIAIQRGEDHIVAPKPEERIYPRDTLLCFGTDEELERFQTELRQGPSAEDQARDLEAYSMQALLIEEGSALAGCSIRASGLRERFNAMVVGIERQGLRMRSPHSHTEISPGDLLWVVGEKKQLELLGNFVKRPAT